MFKRWGSLENKDGILNEFPKPDEVKNCCADLNVSKATRVFWTASFCNFKNISEGTPRFKKSKMEKSKERFYRFENLDERSVQVT